MFQRFGRSRFSTASSPQASGSPRGLASRLFARGKAGSTPREDSNPDQEPDLLGHKPGVDRTSGEEEDEEGDGNTEDKEGEQELSMVYNNLLVNRGEGRDSLEGCTGGHNQPKEHGVEDNTVVYEAESPDEAALVHAARAYRCTLQGRSLERLLVDLPGVGSLDVHLLHILPFDSTRKRMSVVVQHPLTGQVVVYTKGADSVIMDLAELTTGECNVVDCVWSSLFRLVTLDSTQIFCCC